MYEIAAHVLISMIFHNCRPKKVAGNTYLARKADAYEKYLGLSPG